jgi:signal transduction histidine kinase
MLEELEIKAMKQERSRLSRELHDGLAQELGFLKIKTGQARNQLNERELDKAGKTIDLCYSTLSDIYLDTRLAIDGLRIWPDECEDLSWLNRIADEYSNFHEMNVRVGKFPEGVQIPVEAQAHLIRILQEALNNSWKHAKAHNVSVEVFSSGTTLSFVVKDDGVGFSIDENLSNRQHGFRGMQERADLLGAALNVESAPDHGTTIVLTLPIDKPNIVEKN